MGDLNEEISRFVDEIEKKHDVSKRKKELKQILDKFSELYLKIYGIQVRYIESSELILTYYYYYIINHRVKEYLEDNSNIYKMASTTELVINYVQPIKSSSSDLNTLRNLNAELSMFAAISFVLGWYDIDFHLDSGIETLNDSIKNVLNERLKILANLDREKSMPILFNSQMWEFFKLLVDYYRSASMIR